jgi:hypothetical protein
MWESMLLQEGYLKLPHVVVSVVGKRQRERYLQAPEIRRPLDAKRPSAARHDPVRKVLDE